MARTTWSQKTKSKLGWFSYVSIWLLHQPLSKPQTLALFPPMKFFFSSFALRISNFSSQMLLWWGCGCKLHGVLCVHRATCPCVLVQHACLSCFISEQAEEGSCLYFFLFEMHWLLNKQGLVRLSMKWWALQTQENYKNLQAKKVPPLSLFIFLPHCFLSWQRPPHVCIWRSPL